MKISFCYVSVCLKFFMLAQGAKAVEKKLQDWPPDLSRIDDCFVEYSKMVPFAAGEMLVRFSVDKQTGDLKNLKILKSSFKERSFKECVARDMVRWRMKNKDEREKLREYMLIFRQSAKVSIEPVKS